MKNYGFMKTRLICLFTLVLFLISCEDSESGPTPSNPEKEYYQLPVIFQVLYTNNNSASYVSQKRVSEIIAAVNKLYNNSNNKSVDMNLEFVLATENEQGQQLDEPGVNRIVVNKASFDCEKFMEDRNNLKYLWDTNKYINIVLYTFTEENILGISHLPYTVKPDALDGLNQLNYFPQHSNLNYPHCISINKKWINADSSVEGKLYNSTDVVPTLAHELGHYLGLFHSYNEKEDENGEVDLDICEDTDYCEDTPPYNRSEYEDFCNNYISKLGRELAYSDIQYLIKRTNCLTQEKSIPNNIMDYDYSWLNRFTSNQRERIRYVLTHSPLVPGPKETSASTRTVTGEQEFPMRMIK